jgi:AmmeMemoRadiSam system protein A
MCAVILACGCRGKTERGPAGSGAEETGAVEPSQSGRAKEVAMSADYSFTDEQKAWLMKVAMQSAAAAAAGKDYDPPEPDASWTLVQGKGAAFVTLRRRSDDSLRGCIGHIIARVPLYECVAEMARAAAIHDSRFSPVTPSELEGIHFEISVLTPLQRVQDPEEIVVGKDGVVLKHGYHQGVFLPQVPVEQGWDRTMYLDQLCAKAGLYRAGCWKDEQAQLEKFQAIIWEEEDVK